MTATQGILEPYPLQKTNDADLRALTRVLWGWHQCAGAEQENQSCEMACPWIRYPKLTKFHSLYRKLAASYVPDLESGHIPALKNHQDVFRIITCLKARPDVPRAQLMSDYFGAQDPRASEELPSLEDQERAFNLATRVMTSIACSGEDPEAAALELGTEPVRWRGEASLSQFLVDTFPLYSALFLSNDIRTRLSAETIRRIGRLRLQPTNDIQKHLELDTRLGTLQIYHQTAALQEHLRATRDLPASATVAEQVKMGNIPRQLALEVLDSLNSVLFPPFPESQYILQSLVSKRVFDEDVLHLNMHELRRRNEVEGEYRYLASRLRDLYNEIENPTPRGRFEQWFERRIAQRYFMMATIGGLVAAIILGILGLAVGIFQAFVAWQQWKHPVAA